MDYEQIVKKPGAEWTTDEISVVFEALMRDRVIDGFVSFAYRLLLTTDTTDKLEQAKDLVQAKLIALHQALPHYDPRQYRGRKDPLQNYLFTIIAREAVKINKKTIRQREHQLEETHRAPLPKRPGREEIAEEITPYLECLSLDYRRALTLFYFEGKTCEEAARICGCSVSAFKVRLHRGRAKCRALRRENQDE